MHDTALECAKLFFRIYSSQEWVSAVECGALDVNGSIRDVCPPHIFYLGLDIEHGKSVDIKVDIERPLPLRDDFADCVLSSSQMEHDDFFWMTFLDYARIVRPGGFIYINAPSNGDYHRYPNDNWRFYPDCGHVLVRWAKQNGYDISLVESFVSRRRDDIWNDFVAVFCKGEVHGRTAYIADAVSSVNVWKHGSSETEKTTIKSEDQQMLQEARLILERVEQELAMAKLRIHELEVKSSGLAE